MIVAFSVAPAGGESDSVSVAVAEAVRVVRDSGLPYELNAMFTLVEGEWDEVMDVVRRAVQAASIGATRTSLVLKADIRPGHTNQLQAKVDRVTQHLSS
ncbi:MAG: MTH1187 family thiamine-binding protein [Pseudonocardiaceae bacterium]